MNTIAYDVIDASSVSEGKPHPVSAGPWQVVVIRIGDNFFALNNRCSHAASPIGGGRVRGRTVVCPAHGARFDAATGKCVGALYADILTFAVSNENGRITIRVPARAPFITECAIIQAS